MKGYDGYFALAGVYDKLNEEIDYVAWADFFEKCFSEFSKSPPEIVLDLACGTGRMTRELAKRGYDMIGVDGSSDMLGEAYMQGTEGILYLLQDMREFELYGTVGATVCCLDSLNYLTGEGELERVLKLVHNYSDPDGLFIFDVNTPYKFENVYADNAYVLEAQDNSGAQIYCGWQNFYDAKTKLCDFYLSVFEENDDHTYSRTDEQQKERCYSKEELTSALSTAGFDIVGVYSDYNFSTPDEKCERWYFVTKANK